MSIDFKSLENVMYFFGISPHRRSFDTNESRAPSRRSGSRSSQFGSLYLIFLHPFANFLEYIYHAAILL